MSTNFDTMWIGKRQIYEFALRRGCSKRDILHCLHMEEKELAVKYLGVPLISTRLRAGDCEEIKAKMVRKIQSWHAKHLAYAGRVQLILAVLSSIQIYWCRICILPKKNMKEVEATLRQFLWAGSSTKR